MTAVLAVVLLGPLTALGLLFLMAQFEHRMLDGDIRRDDE